jgi:glyoxylase-like metal-dependent hydrolase (beta-lactamase superfamily II)
MTNFICKACGTQYAATAAPPAQCLICQDERQYVPPGGQQWTTLVALQAEFHNVIKPVEPALTGIGTHPTFAIGQRALLVQTPAGNLLWDCISLIDAPTIAAIKALGGIQAIAISHPHYYSSLAEWGQTFESPVYLHAADQAWVMRPDPVIQFWDGESKTLFGGLTLIRGGGHFPGGAMLHWPAGAGGKGALLSGDIIQVVADRRYVTFMYSYPNMIPLPARTVQRVAQSVAPYTFDRIYGAWWDKVIPADGQAAVRRSAERYIRMLGAE